MHTSVPNTLWAFPFHLYPKVVPLLPFRPCLEAGSACRTSEFFVAGILTLKHRRFFWESLVELVQIVFRLVTLNLSLSVQWGLGFTTSVLLLFNWATRPHRLFSGNFETISFCFTIIVYYSGSLLAVSESLVGLIVADDVNLHQVTVFMVLIIRVLPRTSAVCMFNLFIQHTPIGFCYSYVYSFL
jgi:hypothetical protein